MSELFGQPYDISAQGFYFKTAEDYQKTSAGTRNDLGFPSRNTRSSSSTASASTSNQFRRERPVVGRFDRQLAHCRNAHVDRDRAEPAGFQRHAAHGGLCKAGSRFPAEPLEKFIQPKVVDSLPNRG
jgi:hypothetical protein